MKIKDFLFRPTDIASLVFFRIAFGLLAFLDVLGTWCYYHIYKDAFRPEGFQFKYYGFEWVQPMPEPFMTFFFLAMMGAAVFIIFGKYYRRATLFFALGFSYLFLLEKAHYLNHGYLFIWISFVMFFLPANRAFSSDIFKKPAIRLKTIPYWNLFLLQFLMGVVYFYGGIAKINPDWLNAMPMKLWLRQQADMPILGALWNNEITAWVMSYGGMIFDLTVVFFLCWRKTRIWALGGAIFFHVVNTILFQIGIFPWLSLCLTLLYFPPDFPRKILPFLKNKFPIRANLFTTLPLPKELTTSEKRQKIITVAVISLCLFHLLFPFRHHYFEGNVAWTEEGHRYSWRMMLRSKNGSGYFNLKNLETGKSERVYPRKYLNTRQRRKLVTQPDMILQFAHFLAAEWKAKGVDSLEIYANIRINLNGRKYQRYIDQKVDLSKVEWSFYRESDWILPMESAKGKF